MTKEIDVDVTLGGKDMSRFLIRHTYTRFGGILGILISLAAIVLLIVLWGRFDLTQRVILIVLGLMFTVIQPFMLWNKGRKQLKQDVFQKPFHYHFSAKEIEVSQGEYKEKFVWEDIRRFVLTKEAMYVYMSPVTAFIIPENGCQGKYIAIAELLSEKTGKRGKK